MIVISPVVVSLQALLRPLRRICLNRSWSSHTCLGTSSCTTITMGTWTYESTNMRACLTAVRRSHHAGVIAIWCPAWTCQPRGALRWGADTVQHRGRARTVTRSRTSLMISDICCADTSINSRSHRMSSGSESLSMDDMMPCTRNDLRRLASERKPRHAREQTFRACKGARSS